MSDPLDQLRVHFTGLWVREEGPQGQVYVGRDATGAEVTIAVLAGPLASQPAIRNAFADVVWRHSVGSQPGRATVYAADLHAARPWAAVRGQTGQPGAEQLLGAFAGTAPTAAMPVAPLPPPPPPLPTGLAPVTPTPTPTFQAYLPAPPAARASRPLPWVLGVSAVVVLGLVAVGTLVAMRLLGDDEPDPPVTLPTSPPAQNPQPQSPAPTGSPAPEPTDEPAGEPTLRDVELVSLIGPNFEPGDETFTMAFNGWPFAFRAPGHWDCLRGDEIPLFPGAEIWGCRDLDGNDDQRANVMLWECDSGCDEAEQQEKIDTWLDEADRAEQWDDSPTFYVETDENDDNLYSVDLGHFFGTDDTDELRWMVGVYVESPPDTRADVQKIVNDILSQTG
jgi:hypothetical protein